MTNQANVNLFQQEVSQTMLKNVFGTSAPSNVLQIDSVISKIGASSIVNNGELFQYGSVRTQLNCDKEIQIGEGPNKTTINNNVISTTSGNLVLDPNGAIDCSGNTLINVSGIVFSPYSYNSALPTPITVSGNTPANIFTISTLLNSTYTITTVCSIANVSDAVSSGTFIVEYKVKNVSGLVSVIEIDKREALDIGLIGAMCSYTTLGNNFIIVGMGLIGITINWMVSAEIVRSIF